MRKEVHFEYGSEFDEENFYEAVEEVEGVQAIEYNGKDGLTVAGTKMDVDQFLFREEYDFVRGSVRTMLGKQYRNVEDLPEVSESSHKEVQRLAADGGRKTMEAVDHESPLEGVQESLERGGSE